MTGFEMYQVHDIFKVDNIVAAFDPYCAAGVNPNTVISEVLQLCGYREKDLTDAEIREINSRVAKLWTRYNG